MKCRLTKPLPRPPDEPLQSLAKTMFPPPRWMFEAYPGWAEVNFDVLWTIDELMTFDRCPIDFWTTG